MITSVMAESLTWSWNLLFRFVGFCFRSFRRHTGLFLASMLVLEVLLLAFLYLQSRQYEAVTTFVYVDLHPKIFGDMTTKLNTLIVNDNTVKVAELMNLSEADAEKITRIKVTDSRGKPFHKNYSMRKEPMLIRIDLQEPMPEATLEEAVSYYYNSNPFTADRLELKKKLLQEELKYIERKLSTIDSILIKVYLQPEGLRSSITIEDSRMNDAYELLQFSRELIQRKSDIENGLINPENVFAIDKMILLPKARFTVAAVIKYSVVALFLGFVFGLVWSGIPKTGNPNPQESPSGRNA